MTYGFTPEHELFVASCGSFGSTDAFKKLCCILKFACYKCPFRERVYSGTPHNTVRSGTFIWLENEEPL